MRGEQRGRSTVQGGPQLQEAEESLSTMQQEDAERSVAIKRELSELTDLSLYEKRAAGRRDRTIRRLMKIKQMRVLRLKV